MRKINLTQGKFALVDDVDFGHLNSFKWCAIKAHTGKFYACNTAKGKLHRYIIGAKKGEIVDHINRNPLDNRRQNLRICDFRTNSLNRRPKKMTGISRSGKGTWAVNHKINTKKYFVGTFDSLKKAQAAYREAVKNYDLYGKIPEKKSLRVDNTSGVSGVCFCNTHKKWKAQKRFNGKRYSLGYHKDKESAIRAINNFTQGSALKDLSQ